MDQRCIVRVRDHAVYLMGGVGKSNRISSSVWVMNGPRTVIQGPPLLCSRINHSAVYKDGFIYVIGGYRAIPVLNIDRLDIAEQKWSHFSTFDPPDTMLKTAAVILKDYVYLISNRNMWKIELCRPLQWQQVQRLPGSQAEGVCCAVYNDILYACNEYHLFAYSANSDRWTVIASVPQGGIYPNCVVLNHYLHLLRRDRHHRFDFCTRCWQARTPNPNSRYFSAVYAQSGRIYVAGGADELGGCSDAVYSYDTVSDTWKSEQSLPEARDSMAVVKLTGRLQWI